MSTSPKTLVSGYEMPGHASMHQVLTALDCASPAGCICDPYHNDLTGDTDAFNAFLLENKHAIASKPELDGEQDAILLPNRVYGFVLKDRTWAILSTAPDRLHDIASTNPWKDLVIAKEARSTVSGTWPFCAKAASTRIYVPVRSISSTAGPDALGRGSLRGQHAMIFTRAKLIST